MPMVKEAISMMRSARITISPFFILLLIFAYRFKRSLACLSTGVSSSCYCSVGQMCQPCPPNHIVYGGHYSTPLLNGYAASSAYAQTSANQQHLNSVALNSGPNAAHDSIVSSLDGHDARSVFIQEHPIGQLQRATSSAANSQTQPNLGTSQLDYSLMNEYEPSLVEYRGTLESYSGDVTFAPTVINSSSKQGLPLRRIHLKPRKEFADQYGETQRISTSHSLQSAAIEEAQQLQGSNSTPFIHRPSIRYSSQENRPNSWRSESENVPLNANQYLESQQMPIANIPTVNNSIINEPSGPVSILRASSYVSSIQDDQLSGSQIEPYYSEEEISSEADVYSDPSLTDDANAALSEFDILPVNSEVNTPTSSQELLAKSSGNLGQSASAVASAASVDYPPTSIKSQLVSSDNNIAYESDLFGRRRSNYEQKYSAFGSVDHHASTYHQKLSVTNNSTSRQVFPSSKELEKETEAAKNSTSESNELINLKNNSEAFASRNSNHQMPAYLRGSLVKFTVETSTSRQIVPASGTTMKQFGYSQAYPSNKRVNNSSSYQENFFYSWQQTKRKSAYGEETSTAATATVFGRTRQGTLNSQQESPNVVTFNRDVVNVGQRFSTANGSSDTSILNHKQLPSVTPDKEIIISHDRSSISEHSSVSNSTIFQSLSKFNRSSEEAEAEESLSPQRYSSEITNDRQETNVLVQPNQKDIMNRQTNFTLTSYNKSDRNASMSSSKSNSTFHQELSSSENSLEKASTDLSDVHPINQTAESPAANFTTELDIVSRHEEQLSTTATVHQHRPTLYQNLPSSIAEKSVSAISQAMMLTQNSSSQLTYPIIDERDRNRVLVGNGFFPKGMDDNRVPSKHIFEIDQQSGSLSPMNTAPKTESSAVFAMQQQSGTDRRRGKMYSASNSKIHVMGSQIKDTAYATIAGLRNNRIRGNSDEQKQIEVEPSRVTAETNSYEEPLTFKSNGNTVHRNKVTLSAIQTTTPHISSSAKASHAKVTNSYLSTLRRIQKERRDSSPYITYYNQVCTGIFVGMSHGEAIASAAKKCAELECEAMNARPEGSGRYEIVFLKKVDGRRPKTGNYCVSGTTIDDETNNSTRTRSKKLNIRPIETKLATAIADIEFNAATLNERLAQAESRWNGSPRFGRRIIVSNRFVTTEPKSES